MGDRFDGYDFKYYSHNPVDTTSIPYGWVNAIGQDNFEIFGLELNKKLLDISTGWALEKALRE